MSIIDSLEEILKRPNMLAYCEEWRKMEHKDNVISDVYQYDAEGLPFLAAPNNFLLMLNCDWFQPFTHTQFSVGVLYIATKNVPR